MNNFFNELRRVNDDLDKTQYTKRNYFSEIKDSIIEININNFVALSMGKTCDILSITHIEFNIDPSILTENDKFTILIGGNVIYDISFKFLVLTNKIKNINGNYLLPINDIYFFFVAMEYHETKIKISINNTSIDKINLLTKQYSLMTDERRRFAYISHEKYVYCPKSIYKTVNSTNVNYIIDFGGIIDGYYLESNIANIKSISINYWDSKLKKTIFFNNENLIDYDVSMIQNKCVKLDDKLLFIPFDTKKMPLIHNLEGSSITKYFKF